MIAIGVALVLGVWLLLSAVVQFQGRRIDAIHRFDPFRLLPKWTFFAPNPGSTDYHLVYRDFTGDAATPWRELPVIVPNSGWRWLWNPRKRVSKALTDCTQNILDIGREPEIKPDVLPFALPYIAVLNAVASLPASEDVEARQFAIVETEGYVADGPPQVLIASAVHPLRSAP